MPSTFGMASAKRPVTVHISTSTLKVEYKDTNLALYIVAWHEDYTHITEVSNLRVIETSYRSPQLTLWMLGPDEWLLFKKRRKLDVLQLPLPAIDAGQQPAISSS
jgi:hypothetical protein